MPNLFAGLAAGGAEQFPELLARPGPEDRKNLVSTGQASPSGFWYDQPAYRMGAAAGRKTPASLLFEDESAPRQLQPGDYLEIAPHRRHRVESTHPELATRLACGALRLGQVTSRFHHLLRNSRSLMNTVLASGRSGKVGKTLTQRGDHAGAGPGA